MGCDTKATEYFCFQWTSFAFESFSLGFLVESSVEEPLVAFLVWQKGYIQQIQTLAFFRAHFCLQVLKGQASPVTEFIFEARTIFLRPQHNKSVLNFRDVTRNLTSDYYFSRWWVKEKENHDWRALKCIPHAHRQVHAHNAEMECLRPLAGEVAAMLH